MVENVASVHPVDHTWGDLMADDVSANNELCRKYPCRKCPDTDVNRVTHRRPICRRFQLFLTCAKVEMYVSDTIYITRKYFNICGRLPKNPKLCYTLLSSATYLSICLNFCVHLNVYFDITTFVVAHLTVVPSRLSGRYIKSTLYPFVLHAQAL